MWQRSPIAARGGGAGDHSRRHYEDAVAIPGQEPAAAGPDFVRSEPWLSAQTGAASLTGIVTDASGAVVPGRDGDRHQPGHQRRLHRRLERGRQLHDDRHCRSGPTWSRRSCRASRPPRPSRSRWRPSRSYGSTSSWSSAGVEETVEVTSETQVLQTETATVGQVISGTTLNSLPLNGRNTGQLSLLLPGAVSPNPSAFTDDPQLQRRPALRERQPRADQQLHHRRRGHERVDRQPGGVPAEP